MVASALLRRYYPPKLVDVYEQEEISMLRLMVSFAADLDLITDWIFSLSTLVMNDEVSSGLKAILLFFTTIATLTWVIYVSNGRILRWLRVSEAKRTIDVGNVCIACIVIEDIPQMVLTSLIENEWSFLAIMNISSSAYDLFLKLAEAYDQRGKKVYIRKLVAYEKKCRKLEQARNQLRTNKYQDIDKKIIRRVMTIARMVDQSMYSSAYSDIKDILPDLQSRIRKMMPSQWFEDTLDESLSALAIKLARAIRQQLQGYHRGVSQELKLADIVRFADWLELKGLKHIYHEKMVRLLFDTVYRCFMVLTSALDKWGEQSEAIRAMMNFESFVDSHRLRYEHMYWDVMLRKGQHLLLLGEQDESIAAFDRVINDSSLRKYAKVISKETTANSYLQRGLVSFYCQRNIDMALMCFNTAMDTMKDEIDPKSPFFIETLAYSVLSHIWKQEYTDAQIKKNDMTARLNLLLAEYKQIPIDCTKITNEISCLVNIVCAIHADSTQNWANCANVFGSNHIKTSEALWQTITTRGGQFSMKKVELCFLFMLYYEKKGNLHQRRIWKSKGLDMLTKSKKLSKSLFLNELRDNRPFWKPKGTSPDPTDAFTAVYSV